MDEAIKEKADRKPRYQDHSKGVRIEHDWGGDDTLAESLQRALSHSPTFEQGSRTALEELINTEALSDLFYSLTNENPPFSGVLILHFKGHEICILSNGEIEVIPDD